MKLDGHARLTNSAIRSFKSKCKQATDIFIRDTVCRAPQFNTMNIDWHNWNSSNAKDNMDLVYFIASQEISLLGEGSHNLHKGYLTREVVAVDLEPLKLRYHVLDSGQKFHFMRKSNGQTISFAHSEATQLIKSRAENWLRHMHRVFFGKKRHGRNNVSKTPARRRAVSELAIALHALQDSFSPAHTKRTAYTNPKLPGAITDIYIYADQNHDEHGEQDFESGSANSIHARSAVFASSELMSLCANSIAKRSTSLIGWEEYKTRWIRLSGK